MKKSYTSSLYSAFFSLLFIISFISFISLITLTFTSATSTAMATPLKLPTATSDIFLPGQYWVWVYYEKGDLSRPYSYEKYVVQEREGNRITLILKSKFKAEDSFQDRQKMILSLQDCLKAYTNPLQIRYWQIENFYYADGRWNDYSLGYKTDIFEEKFNCNPHIFPHHHVKFQTHFQTINEVSVFQQFDKLARGKTSWYINRGENPGNDRDLWGVTYVKEFAAGTDHSYLMKLESWGKE